MELALDHAVAEFAEVLAVVIAVGVDYGETAGRVREFRQFVEDGGEIPGCVAALIEGAHATEIAGIATADTEQDRGKDQPAGIEDAVIQTVIEVHTAFIDRMNGVVLDVE
jgi:hypothetical protein